MTRICWHLAWTAVIAQTHIHEQTGPKTIPCFTGFLTCSVIICWEVKFYLQKSATHFVPAVNNDDSWVRVIMWSHTTSECNDGTRADRDAVIRPRCVVELFRVSDDVGFTQLKRSHDKINGAFDRRQRHANVSIHLLFVLGIWPILLTFQLQQTHRRREG